MRQVLLFFYVAVILTPTLVAVALSFNSASTTWPPKPATFHWYTDALIDGKVVSAITVSACATALAALLSTGVGFSVAAYEQIRHTRVPALLVVLSLLPCLLPPSVVGSAAHLSLVKWGLKGGFVAIILAHTAFCTPVAYLLVRAGCRELGKSRIAVARNLGARDVAIALQIVAPLVRGYLVTSILLCNCICWSDHMIAWFVGDITETCSVYLRLCMAASYTPRHYAVSTLAVGTAAGVVAAQILLVIKAPQLILLMGTPSDD